DHINAHKKEIEPLLYKKADGLLRDYITQISLRDLRFINPGSFDKIRASQKDA
ncbi:MAG: hypothetical protein GY864_14545, partial [Desulfobacterales bacterium]|nr:hypothetical protein [Desulfobacterales bacterium]